MADRTVPQPGSLPADQKRSDHLAAALLTEESEQLAYVTSPAWAWLPAGHQLAVLGRRVARSLVMAGFSFHHCAEADPLYQLGGVCVLPVPESPGEHLAGIAVSWTTHHSLALDESKWATCAVLTMSMNSALGQVLRTLGYDAEPFGTGGAWIIAMAASEEREAYSR